jgi:diphthamide synthase (EF-2-diphthine--ammonia ligase)
MFPAWHTPTEHLGRDMIAAGVKAKITCVDPSKLAKSFAGREYDLRLLQALPPGTDPCGENGEFHTFVYDAPVFSRPIEVRTRRSCRTRWLCFCRFASSMTSIVGVDAGVQDNDLPKTLLL